MCEFFNGKICDEQLIKSKKISRREKITLAPLSLEDDFFQATSKHHRHLIQMYLWVSHYSRIAKRANMLLFVESQNQRRIYQPRESYLSRSDCLHEQLMQVN